MKRELVIIGIILSLWREFEVALIKEIADNTIMDKLKELIKKMEDEMRADLKRSGDYESYGEEGIRIAVYEDLNDSLKLQFSDVIY